MGRDTSESLLAACLTRTRHECRLSTDKEGKSPMTLISIPAGRRQASNTLRWILFCRLLSTRIREREKKRERGGSQINVYGRGERTDISPRTFTVKRVDGRGRVEEETRTAGVLTRNDGAGSLIRI